MIKVKVNIDKAKEIKKETARMEREPLLEDLDVQFMQALEKGEDTKGIAAEKQRLRDITKEIDELKTAEELKAFKVE